VVLSVCCAFARIPVLLNTPAVTIITSIDAITTPVIELVNSLALFVLPVIAKYNNYEV
jgi:hypothetical protein